MRERALLLVSLVNIFSEIIQHPPKKSNGKNLIDEKSFSEIISNLS